MQLRAFSGGRPPPESPQLGVQLHAPCWICSSWRFSFHEWRGKAEKSALVAVMAAPSCTAMASLVRAAGSRIHISPWRAKRCLGSPRHGGLCKERSQGGRGGHRNLSAPTGAAGVGSPSLWASCKGRTRQRRAVPRCASIPPEKGVGQHLPRCPPFPQQRKA